MAPFTRPPDAPHHPNLGFERTLMFALIIPYRAPYLFLLLAACLLSACSNSQQPECKITLSNAPEIRGMRLGMTLEGFKDRFKVGASSFSGETFKLEPDKDGVIVATADIGPLDEGGRAHIGQILFVNGRVAHFRIIYENYTNQFAWEDVDQFVEKTAASLGLPKSWVRRQSLPLKEHHDIWLAEYDLLWSTIDSYSVYWHPGDTNDAERFLLCGDILVSAGVPFPGKQDWTNGAFIQFDDLAAIRTLRTRQEERQFEEKRKESELRETFKP
jgi:hypothetical protein